VVRALPTASWVLSPTTNVSPSSAKQPQARAFLVTEPGTKLPTQEKRVGSPVITLAVAIAAVFVPMAQNGPATQVPPLPAKRVSVEMELRLAPVATGVPAPAKSNPPLSAVMAKTTIVTVAPTKTTPVVVQVAALANLAFVLQELVNAAVAASSVFPKQALHPNVVMEKTTIATAL
jgi:hypothetical protein